LARLQSDLGQEIANDYIEEEIVTEEKKE